MLLVYNDRQYVRGHAEPGQNTVLLLWKIWSVCWLVSTGFRKQYCETNQLLDLLHNSRFINIAPHLQNRVAECKCFIRIVLASRVLSLRCCCGGKHIMIKFQGKHSIQSEKQHMLIKKIGGYLSHPVGLVTLFPIVQSDNILQISLHKAKEQ